MKFRYIRNTSRIRVAVVRVESLELVYAGKCLSSAALALEPGCVFAVATNLGRAAIEARWEAVRVRDVYYRAGWLGKGYPPPPLPRLRPRKILLRKRVKSSRVVYESPKPEGVSHKARSRVAPPDNRTDPAATKTIRRKPVRGKTKPRPDHGSVRKDGKRKAR